MRNIETDPSISLCQNLCFSSNINNTLKNYFYDLSPLRLYKAFNSPFLKKVFKEEIEKYPYFKNKGFQCLLFPPYNQNLLIELDQNILNMGKKYNYLFIFTITPYVKDFKTLKKIYSEYSEHLLKYLLKIPFGLNIRIYDENVFLKEIKNYISNIPKIKIKKAEWFYEKEGKRMEIEQYYYYKGEEIKLKYVPQVIILEKEI